MRKDILLFIIAILLILYGLLGNAILIISLLLITVGVGIFLFAIRINKNITSSNRSKLKNRTRKSKENINSNNGIKNLADSDYKEIFSNQFDNEDSIINYFIGVHSMQLDYSSSEKKLKLLVGLTNNKLLIMYEKKSKINKLCKILLHDIYDIRFEEKSSNYNIHFIAKRWLIPNEETVFAVSKNIQFNFKKVSKSNFLNFSNKFLQCVEDSKKALKDNYIQLYGNEYANCIFNSEVSIGMTKEMVILSIGEPKDIKKEVLKEKTKEEWFYEAFETNRGITKYKKRYNFVNDLLVGWKDL